MLRAIEEEDNAVVVLDQTSLPRQIRFIRLTSLTDAAQAINIMQVRGAPLIGVTAAYGVALALRAGISLAQASQTLAATRPTAINLHWALARMQRVLEKAPVAMHADIAWQEARAIAHEDAQTNAAIGQYGLPLLQTVSDRPTQVMTHCNAGWLAAVAHGTALAPIYAAHAAGIALHIWVSETRPRNQGLLTAWELYQAGIAHTLFADNAAGLLLMRGEVDLIIVGADRITANGDTVNKIGTYLKALAARAHGIPFYVAAPVATIDFASPSGAAVPIEERDATEFGDQASRGDTPVVNPAFDVTPAALIRGIITEQGVFAPDALASIVAPQNTQARKRVAESTDSTARRNRQSVRVLKNHDIRR